MSLYEQGGINESHRYPHKLFKNIIYIQVSINKDFMKTISLNFLVIFLITSPNIMGQQLFNCEKLPKGNYSGYIVTLNNDTIFGEIVVPVSFPKLFNSVEFIDGNNSTKTYYPKELLAYHFGTTHFIGNTLVYIQNNSGYGRVFVQQLVDGYLKYYKHLYNEVEIYSAVNLGVAVIPKVDEDFYFTFGSIIPNKIWSYRDLLSVVWDHQITYDTIRKRAIKEDIPKILYDYNCWLSASGKGIEKMKLDSTYALTKLDLEGAFNDSLLCYKSYDKNFYDYVHRVIYYAANTPKYRRYFIYEKIDEFGRTYASGLRVLANEKYVDIGT
jgi:hypothetical protein